jgi:hypothetical protein
MKPSKIKRKLKRNKFRAEQRDEKIAIQKLIDSPKKKLESEIAHRAKQK